MSYYHVPTLVERGPGRYETKLSDGATLSPPLGGWTPELAALCGFVVVVNTARPADTATHTSDRSVVWNGTTATVTWTVRPKTQAELDADAAAAAKAAKFANVATAVATLRLWSDQAETTTVTSGNAVATLQTVVNRLGIFFDRFADLIESRML